MNGLSKVNCTLAKKHFRMIFSHRAIFAFVFLFLFFGVVYGQNSSSMRSADRTLAIVNRRIFTERDLDFLLIDSRLYSPELEAAPDEELRKRLLPRVIDDYMLAAWAELEVIEPPEEAVNARYEATMKRYEELAGGRTKLKKICERYGLTDDKFRDWAKKEARDNLIMRDAIGIHADLGGLTPYDGELKNAVRIRIGHILFRDLGNGEGQQAYEKALRVRRDIAAGLSFAEAAKLYSEDDYSKQKGGILGWFHENEVNQVIWNHAQQLKFGQVSSPVYTDVGYHLLYVFDYETQDNEEYTRRIRETEREQLKKLREDMDIYVAEGYSLSQLDEEPPMSERDTVNSEVEALAERTGNE